MIEKVRDAISSMRYEGGVTTALYWFIRVALVAVPVLIALCIAGLVYCTDLSRTTFLLRRSRIPKTG